MAENNHLAAQITTPVEIDRIAAIEDPISRNLQITQCYHELSGALGQRIGLSANWCTFATWASKQAGQTIRKEDLKQLLEIRLSREFAPMLAADNFAASVPGIEKEQAARLQRQALDPQNFTSAIARASDAVGRGNKMVFEEIAREFASFFETCLSDRIADDEKITHFCEALRPGDPPEGQQYLRQAFTHYYALLFEEDAKTRAELILLANIKIGFHEQTRLQPEIAQALDAGLISSLDFTRRLLASIFPHHGWLALSQHYVRRLFGRQSPLDKALESLLAATRVFLRETLTEIMMTLSIPCDVRLRLGEDLTAGFPPSLQQINNLDLKSLLGKLDPTPDDLTDSGARDWADLPDRLHFILDLFRTYQENRDLFDPPFTTEQVAAIKAGKLPEGKL